MNKKAIFEIGNLIHVRYKGSFNPIKWFKPQELTPEELIESEEFKMFQKQYPELTRLSIEGEKNE